jgi:uncharacterized protein YdiU (UPF0061 family)
MMGNKLGLDQVRPADIALISRFEKMLSVVNPDMTIFFQRLIDLPSKVENTQQVIEHFSDSLYKLPVDEKAEELFDTIAMYLERRKTNETAPETVIQVMRGTNPRFILRNYLLHQAIEEMESGEGGLFAKLQDAIKAPYAADHKEFFGKRPDWAGKKAGCSMLSCSS